jgi:hypothetical protein
MSPAEGDVRILWDVPDDAPERPNDPPRAGNDIADQMPIAERGRDDDVWHVEQSR